MAPSKYVIDNMIQAESLAEKANWKLSETIEALMAEGLSRSDAEDFASFLFTTHAIENGGRADQKPEDCVSEQQWSRLSLG